ncbi:hypothetical protein FQN53_006892 [Emmonsiellopsis sp. PD_33]|nr:hypothetical protein FQN53_006892 [Emmonsiellopsis sp. PD_33]
MADCPADELPALQLYADGKFYYPNGTPRCVDHEVNTASTWHEWTVTSDVTNHSTPFVFRIVNAQGSSGNQMGGGFLSGQFYIDFKDDSPTTTTSSMTTTTTTTSSTQSSTGDPTQSNIPPATAIPSSAHTEQSSPKEAGGPNNSIVALGVGIGLGVPFCVAVGAAVFFARRRNKQTPLPPPAPDYTTPYWKAELEQKPATQELQGDSEWDANHWANQHPVRYELG